MTVAKVLADPMPPLPDDFDGVRVGLSFGDGRPGYWLPTEAELKRSAPPTHTRRRSGKARSLRQSGSAKQEG